MTQMPRNIIPERPRPRRRGGLDPVRFGAWIGATLFSLACWWWLLSLLALAWRGAK